MHWLHALRALEVGPPLLELDLDVDLETLDAKEMRTVLEDGKVIQGVSEEAEVTLFYLKDLEKKM